MIYFPITCNVLTPGHIKCLQYLVVRDDLVIGLLTSKALEGYKKERMSYRDRLFILKTIIEGIGGMQGIKIIPQNSLNPIRNLKKYNCTSVASGDGFEEIELKAIKKLNLETINIRLKGEKGKRYSSSKV